MAGFNSAVDQCQSRTTLIFLQDDAGTVEGWVTLLLNRAPKTERSGHTQREENLTTNSLQARIQLFKATRSTPDSGIPSDMGETTVNMAAPAEDALQYLLPDSDEDGDV